MGEIDCLGYEFDGMCWAYPDISPDKWMGDG